MMACVFYSVPGSLVINMKVAKKNAYTKVQTASSYEPR